MDEYGTCLCQDCVTSVTRLDEYGARECHECVTSVSGLKLVWVEFGKNYDSRNCHICDENAADNRFCFWEGNVVGMS